jgi:hypothetical protein
MRLYAFLRAYVPARLLRLPSYGCDHARPNLARVAACVSILMWLAAGDDNSGRADADFDHGSYIHTSKGDRKYVDGFKLNFDRSYSTPFNPERMFDKKSQVHFDLKGCNVSKHRLPNYRKPFVRGSRTEPNRTEPNRTEPNRTEPNRIAATAV